MQVLVFLHATLMHNIRTSLCGMLVSFAAGALNPRSHYAYGTAPNLMKELREAFEYMPDTDTCITALQEAKHFRRRQGTFSTELTQRMAYDKITSLGMFLNFPLHSSLLNNEGSSF
jgi:hypothetical protein